MSLFPDGCRISLGGHSIVDAVRKEIIETARTTKGPVCIKAECSEQIRLFLKNDPMAEQLIAALPKIESAAIKLLERFEELARRLQRDLSLEQRHECYRVLLSELTLNITQYGIHRKDWCEFVPATLLNRKVVAAIPFEPDFKELDLSLTGLIESIVSHPRDPRGFILSCKAAEMELLENPALVYFHNKLAFIRQACFYHNDPAAHLTNALKVIEQLKSDPKTEELPDWIIEAAVLSSQSKAKQSLISLIKLRDELMADPNLPELGGREWLIYQAFIEAPTQIRNWVVARLSSASSSNSAANQ